MICILAPFNPYSIKDSLSKSQAYRILAMPEMEETKIKIGTKGVRIDLDRAFEIMQQIFR